MGYYSHVNKGYVKLSQGSFEEDISCDDRGWRDFGQPKTCGSQRVVGQRGCNDGKTIEEWGDTVLRRRCRLGKVGGVGASRVTVRCFFLFPRLIMHPSRCAYETVWISSHHHIPVFESFLPHPDLIFITSHPTPRTSFNPPPGPSSGISYSTAHPHIPATHVACLSPHLTAPHFVSRITIIPFRFFLTRIEYHTPASHSRPTLHEEYLIPGAANETHTTLKPQPGTESYPDTQTAGRVKLQPCVYRPVSKPCCIEERCCAPGVILSVSGELP